MYNQIIFSRYKKRSLKIGFPETMFLIIFGVLSIYLLIQVNFPSQTLFISIFAILIILIIFAFLGKNANINNIKSVEKESLLPTPTWYDHMYFLRWRKKDKYYKIDKVVTILIIAEILIPLVLDIIYLLIFR